MKKSILLLAAVFTFSSFFTSCRETEERDDVEIIDNDVEDAVDDAGDAIEEGANEVEEEIEGTDDY